MDGIDAGLAAYYDQEASIRLRRAIDPQRVQRREEFVDLLAAENRETLLEVGAGPGRDSIAFADAGRAPVGIDLSIEHVRLAVADGLAAAQASLYWLPFAAGRFEAGWTMSTLVHVPDSRFDEAMSSITATLQRGAPLAVGMWGGFRSGGSQWLRRDPTAPILQPPVTRPCPRDAQPPRAARDHEVALETLRSLRYGAGGRSWQSSMCSVLPRSTIGRRCVGRPKRSVASFVAAGTLAAAVFVGVLATPDTSSAASARDRRSCPRSDSATYTVVDGDTWFGIARIHDIKLGPLFKANDATESSSIHPGDVLCLPTGATTSTGAPNQVPTSCSRDSSPTHTVVAGDSWFGVARIHDVKIGSLFKANGATESSPIHPGDVLCLPDGAATAAATSTTTLPRGSGGVQALPAQGPCSYVDSWLAPRGSGRRHEGVDLIAKTGQYVYAVADGTLTQRVWAQPGLRAGNAWWLTAADGSGTYYFYAHLSDFAPGLKAGSEVKAGQIIGFVGATGNTALAHLHFEIHPNGGAAVNPYPTIKAMGGCKTGAPYEQPV